MDTQTIEQLLENLLVEDIEIINKQEIPNLLTMVCCTSNYISVGFYESPE